MRSGIVLFAVLVAGRPPVLHVPIVSHGALQQTVGHDSSEHTDPLVKRLVDHRPNRLLGQNEMVTHPVRAVL
jgi:hypothetical protein